MSARPDFHEAGPEAIVALERCVAVIQVSQQHVPDGAWSSVHGHVSPEELTDLTLPVVAINGRNRFAIAFRKLPA